MTGQDVRRAEYALGIAIREGQAAGEIRKQGQGARDGQQPVDNRLLPASPYDFASPAELSSGDTTEFTKASDEVVVTR